MKRVGIGVSIVGILLVAACSDDTTGGAGNTSGTGTGGTAVAGGGAGGSAAGTGGSGTAGSAAGTAAGGGGSGGMAAGTGGGGSGGAAAGTGGAGGSGGSGGGAPACETKLGKAVKFAGGNTVDLIAGDLGADGPQGDDARTLELWAKFTGDMSWEAEHTILELGVPPADDKGNNVFGIDLSGRKDAGTGVFGPYTHGCSDNNGTGAPPQLAAASNVGWLHLSWAYDPTKADATKRLEFTVNGNVLPTEFNQQKYDATGGKLVLNTGYVLLGASQHFGHGGWDGTMDEVRIWKAYRTPQQIKDNMKVIVKPDSAGLVAYYQFNEGDAANVSDSTKKATHKLAACTAVNGACPEANGSPPTFVDNDFAEAFTCGQ